MEINKEEKNISATQKSRFFDLNNRLFSVLVGLIFAGIFCTGIYALAYTYNPGDTLDPSCLPTDEDCIAPPAVYSFGANNFSGTGGFTTTLGTISAEQLTSTDDLTVADTALFGSTLTLATGSITDSTGAISFGDDDISTTGTGTFGKLKVNTSNLVVNAVGYENRVGIGTATPNNKLQVIDLINFDNTGFNTKLGYEAGKNITSGAVRNTYFGYQAGISGSVGDDTADYNSAFGYQAFYSNTTGLGNSAFGTDALRLNTTGNINTAIGSFALASNTTGMQNTAIGSSALAWNTTGRGNTALGQDALEHNSTGGYNTALGGQALWYNETGSGNIALGYYAGYNETGSDTFYVDNQVRGSIEGDRAGSLLYGTFNATPANQTLRINANVGIGTAVSDAKLVVDNGTVSTGGFDYTNWFKSGLDYYTDDTLGTTYAGGLGYASTTDYDNEVSNSYGLAGISNSTGSYGIGSFGKNGGGGGFFVAGGGGVGLLALSIDPSSYAFVSYQGANLLLGQTAMGGNEDVAQLVVVGTDGQTANLQEWRDSEGGVLASIDSTGKLTAVGGIDPPYMLFDLQTREEISGKLSQGIPSDKKGGAMVFFNSNTKRLEYYVQTEGLFYDLQGNIINESGAIGSGEVYNMGTSSTDSISLVSTETMLDRVKNILAGFGILIKNGVVNIKNLVVENFSSDVATVKYLQMITESGDIYCTWIDNNGEWQKLKGECTNINTASLIDTQLDIVEKNTELIKDVEDFISASQADKDKNSDEIKEETKSNEILEEGEVSEDSSQSIQETLLKVQKMVQKADQVDNSDKPIQQQVEQQIVEQQIKEPVEDNKKQTSQKTDDEIKVKDEPILKTLNIISIISISNINVDYGTPIGSIGLPQKITSTLSDGSIQDIPINWDNGIPTYNENTSGNYVFSGTLMPPENITNTNNFNANVNVILGQRPEEKENLIEATSDLIENTTSSLLNGSLNLIEGVITSISKISSSVPIAKRAGASLINSVDVLRTELFLLIQQTFSNLSK